MMIVGLFLNLLIFGVFIFGIKKLFSRGNRHLQKEGGVRRFFQLGLLFGLAIISAVGVSGLLGRLVRIGTVITTDRGNLAMESAFAVVGLPIFAVIALWARNTLRKDPDEAKTLAWNLYLTAISVVSLVLVIDAQMNLYKGIFTDNAVRGKDFSQLLVWGALWLFHFRMHNRLGREENTLGEHLIGSVIGLGFSFVGIFTIIAGLLAKVFGLEENSLIVSSGKPLINGLITLAVGAPVWYIYWIRTAEKAVKETLWYAYVLLIGVGGGLFAAIIPAALVLDSILVWFFGDVSKSASVHFLDSPQMVGASLTGLLILWYHRDVLNASEQTKRTDVRRIYEYVVSGIGLLAASLGITMILVSIIQAISVNIQITGSTSMNTFLGAITLIVVGGPVWWIQWHSIQNRVQKDKTIEQSSIIRRIYLLILFGVVGVTAVIVLLIAAYITFYDAFQNGVSLNTFNKMRFPIGIFLTAAVISWYHWSVYRTEKDVEIIRNTLINEADNEKLYFFVELKIKPRSTNKVIDVLNKYAVYVRKENGCEKLDVLIDPKVKNTIYLYEIWSNSQSHQAHLNSEGFKGWKAYSDPLITSFSVKTLEPGE